MASQVPNPIESKQWNGILASQIPNPIESKLRDVLSASWISNYIESKLWGEFVLLKVQIQLSQNSGMNVWLLRFQIRLS